MIPHMTHSNGFPGSEPQPSQRRRFAASRQYKVPGIVLAVFSGVGLLNVLLAVITTGGDPRGLIRFIFPITVFGLASIYLLRGPKMPPAAHPFDQLASRVRGMAAPMLTEQTAELITQITRHLQQVQGGAALVVYRRLESTVQRYYPHDAQLQLSRALESINFDMSTLNSPRLGYLPTNDGPALEVFRDWIVHGEVAHDVEPSTHGRVSETGSVQIHSEIVTDRKGQVSLVDKEVDNRATEVLFTSDSWQLNVAMPPGVADEAQRIIREFNDQNESRAY